MDSDGDTRNSSQEENFFKRRMKTPFQLEALERVYAEDRYPTEAVRAELALHLNLSDKQLQMWFCHRRLKERKGKEDEVVASRKRQKTDRSGLTFDGYQTAVFEPEVLHNDMRDTEDDYDDFEDDYGCRFCSESCHRRKSDGPEATFASRKGTETLVGKSRKTRTIAENVAIAAVKSHLREVLRDDGPQLGLEFDPLPLGAFSSSIERKSERKSPLVSRLPNGNIAEDRQEAHPSKPGVFGLPPLPSIGMKRKGSGLCGELNVRAQHLSRASQEVQFLLEKPFATEVNNHRQFQLNLHPYPERSYELGPTSRIRSLSPLGAFFPANMHLTLGDGYGFQQEGVENFGSSLLPPGESRASGLHAKGLGLDEPHCRGLYGSFQVEGQGALPQSTMQDVRANQLSVGFEILALIQEQEQTCVEKKRKTDEMKIAKESEACAKRMRRDLERQEVLRRKREEQMRKELEKQDRDRRKEEERAVRERRREGERIQREQWREIERQEKMALKENKKMEKQHRREELRKAKEAAKLKAATERAAAKKLSKEWMDTIDDEQLELLEASPPHGLFSESGNAEVNENSEVLLKKFPPASVGLKPALSFCPWTGPDHSAGHFFMVWRFLATFGDVIGLWPFTLDEFGQALHDFDPRLLGDIHVCLIKMVVKNVEDAAQAAANGASGSQNAINLVSGGHPQIVEAAHDWGFDIRDWGQFVSPLTWPDILRQLGLAAGYGPKWRRCSKGAMRHAEDAKEHIEEESAVTALRSGVAAANAVAMMQGKRVGQLRRCRYRLTPGTVKYAAFHVLSLEGSKGLTVLEVAEKIQKSGLRDLKTSKTPEASIAAALSRDTNLFERVAASTYCVRPAFRKDAEEAEEVLQSARERIDLFQSGFLDVEEADKDTDETEDYYSDGQDAEDGDVHTPICKDSDAKEKIQAEVMGVNNLAGEDVEVDETQVGEPWVQGLTEGEYSDLSIEERLMALVALVDVVNEGNAIRLALEGRMEASSTVKRQMWAETQIDRRRHKEEQLSRLQSMPVVISKSECGGLSIEGDAPLGQVVRENEKSNDPVARAKNGTPLELTARLYEPLAVPDGPAMNESILASQEKNIMIHEKDTLFQEGLLLHETALAPCFLTERSRAQGKLKNGILAEELYFVRSLPLGLDRRRNRYWQFVTCSGGQDPSQGRIYLESGVDGHWEIIDTEAALDALLTSLDVRGTREAALHAVLGRLDGSLRRAMRAAEECRSSAQCHGKLDTPESGILSDIFEGAGTSGLLCHTKGDGDSRTGRRLRSPNTIGATVLDFEKSACAKQCSFKCFKDFEQWMWTENSTRLSSFGGSKVWRKRESELLTVCAKCHDLYWAAEKYCQSCRQTVGNSQIRQGVHAEDLDGRMRKNEVACQPGGSSIVVQPRIQVLKCNIISMEVTIPSEACKDVWNLQRRIAWASLVKCAVTANDLLQAMVELESKIKQDWLTSLLDTSESLSVCRSYCLLNAVVAPWVPRTSAAVGLRMKAFDAALETSSEQKRQKEVVEEDIRHNSIYMFTQHTMEDLATPDNPEREDNGEVLGDVVAARGRGRGKGSRGNRTNKKSDRQGILKKKSKRKLHEEISAITTKDVFQGKMGGSGHGRYRGRPRGHGIGRPRGRWSRVGHRNQVFLLSAKMLREEKDPNDLSSQQPTSKRTLTQGSTVQERSELGQECQDEEVFRESVLELDDAQDMKEENTCNVVEEDANRESQPDDVHQTDKGDEIQKESNRLVAMQKGGKGW